MRISIIAIGKKVPEWVQSGVDEYSRRLQRDYDLSFVEIASSLSGTSADQNLRVRKEGITILEKTKKRDYVIALDQKGAHINTSSLASKLDTYQGQGRDLVFLIGGADGLHKSCLERADEIWSISELTFPHALVRVVLTEQLYRANSILKGHPYHRE
tara:strand:- start:149 stop:619 length:471 start_codon:yes stop_codon:yes gene_type:complete